MTDELVTKAREAKAKTRTHGTCHSHGAEHLLKTARQVGALLSVQFFPSRIFAVSALGQSSKYEKWSSLTTWFTVAISTQSFVMVAVALLKRKARPFSLTRQREAKGDFCFSRTTQAFSEPLPPPPPSPQPPFVFHVILRGKLVNHFPCFGNLEFSLAKFSSNSFYVKHTPTGYHAFIF